MVTAFDLRRHVHCGESLPGHAIRTTVKTEYVATVHPHRRARAHRPTYTLVATVDGTTTLCARFACGGASINVRAVASVEGTPLTPCPRCDSLARPEQFHVYAYIDREGRILYVGQTRDLDARHRAHRHDPRSASFADDTRRMVLSTHATRTAALAAEARAIARLRPAHNTARPAVAA